METENRLPHLFSISTVGLRKHFNQDYLLHPIRTDFTGDGGVGKSMIADFLQVLFVWNRDVIKFGTEAIGNEPRDVKGMLHEQRNEGFIFVNIELLQDKFIAMGVCISRNGSPTLKPFLLLNHANWDLKSESVCFDQPIRSSDFVDTNRVVDFEELPIHFQKKSLYFFNKSKEQQDFYLWLYERKILPINLSQESNLKAFAKVVQSFSKAKALDLTKSASLQEFLFDDAAAENERKFDEKKSEIQDTLADYKANQDEISELKHKQTFLLELSGLNDKQYAALYDWKKAGLVLSQQILNKSEREFSHKKRELAAKEEQKNGLDEQKSNFEEKELACNERFRTTSKDVEHLIDYKSVLVELHHVNEKIERLSGNIEEKRQTIGNHRAQLERDYPENNHRKRKNSRATSAYRNGQTFLSSLRKSGATLSKICLRP
jgi:DNA repair protein SbcC/Rad50